MAGCSSWQADEEKREQTVIRKPGEKPGVDVLREILLYLVENISGVNLRGYSRLTDKDDKSAYKEMAKKAADPAFHMPEVNPTALDVARSIFHDKIQNYCRKPDIFQFTEQTAGYVNAQIVIPWLKRKPVTCIKRIYALAVMFAQMVQRLQDLDEFQRDELCQHIVEGILLAIEWREEEYDSQPIECYVNIWEMDYTPYGGLQNLKPRVCAPLPAGRDIPGTGAELVKHMLSSMTCIPITKVYGVPQQQGNLNILKAIVVKLVDVDWRTNPVTSDNTAERELLEIYNNMLVELRKDRDACETKKYHMRSMSLQIKRVLVGKVLSNVHHERYQAWAAFFILISKVVKEIQQQPNAMVDEAVLTSFSDAMFSTMNTDQVKQIEQSDPNLWLNIESNYGYLLNQ